MNKKELLEFVQTGEGYTLEFKEGLSNSIGKEICAFANASGGKIVLGVSDTGTIKGYKLKNSEISQIQDIARNMDPPFSVNIEQVDDLAVIFVPEGKQKPYAVNGHFYLRQGANSQQLKRDEVRNFFQRENMIQFDRMINSEFKDADFDNGIFELFREKLNIPKTLLKKHVLSNLALLTDDKVNNAGALFFSNHISRLFPNAVIVGVVHGGTSRANILDKKEFGGDMLSNFNSALNYVLANIHTNISIVGRERVERPEIAQEALREAIINAIVHRDYFSNGRVQIDIFSDRVEISNPGALLFDKSRLGELSISRNPIISDMFHRLHYIERIGSGVARMRELAPSIVFDISSNWFRTIFARKAIDAKTVENVITGEKTREKTREKIIELIKDNPTITTGELADKIGLTAKGIEWNIRELKEKGLLKRIGPDKGGHWEVKEII